MFGGSLSRNMVNASDTGLPTEWAVEEGKRQNIKWVARLGNRAYGGPVIAGGKVFVGTNNTVPRDPKTKGSRAVLMCFAEADGKFLWQAVHDYPAEIGQEARAEGLCSTPAIDGNRLYYVTPGCELVCADTADGKTIWKLDMMKDLKVVPYHLGNCSPLVVGDSVFVMTSNGVDDQEGKVASPKAPSFIAVNKTTGKLAWQSNLPGNKIIEGQWSNPVYAEVNGKPQVIFPGGDDFLYAFEAATGNLIWKFNVNPGKAEAKGKIPNYMVATPVIHDNKLYVGLGLYPEHPSPTRFSYFLCIDITGTGDVSPVSLDSKKAENKKSGLVWSYGGMIEPKPQKGRPVTFARTMSTAAVHDGLVYISEEAGYLHCLDAKTGRRYWEHDFLSAVWGSPYWVDNKVYIGTEDGDIVIFAHGKEKKLIRQVTIDETGVHSTPVAVNGVLYVATPTKLYAIASK
jgi:outer membrane protein assembly factor BamB